MRTAFLGVLASAWISIPPPAHAAVFTVTNLDNAGPGSLRQAVLDANATAGADDVMFQSGLSGTIVFSDGPLFSEGLVIDDDLRIHGPGAGSLSVRGSREGGFWVRGGAAVTLSGLTLTGAFVPYHHGGGVYVGDGSLTLMDSVVSYNTASGAGGGLYLSGGSHVIRNTSIVGNRAGVQTSGDLSAVGGGIYLARGTLTIENSTLSGNSVFGGVHHFPGAGGGLYASSSTVHILNSTFSGNSAVGYGAAASFSGSTAYLSLTTVNQNSNGGLFWSGLGSLSLDGGEMHLDHSIVANASNPGGVNLYRAAGTIHAIYSLIETPDPDINGTSWNNVIGKDPVLGPLQANGGPTATHALLPGSPAINRGNPLIADAPAFDQRGPGFPRVAHGVVDIGSFESDYPFLAEVPLLSPVGLFLLVGGLLAAGLRAVRGRLAGR